MLCVLPEEGFSVRVSWRATVQGSYREDSPGIPGVASQRRSSSGLRLGVEVSPVVIVLVAKEPTNIVRPPHGAHYIASTTATPV